MYIKKLLVLAIFSVLSVSAVAKADLSSFSVVNDVSSYQKVFNPTPDPNCPSGDQCACYGWCGTPCPLSLCAHE